MATLWPVCGPEAKSSGPFKCHRSSLYVGWIKVSGMLGVAGSAPLKLTDQHILFKINLTFFLFAGKLFESG